MVAGTDNRESKSPTYMGLRVHRYTPWTTNEDAMLALTGFTVVLARQTQPFRRC